MLFSFVAVAAAAEPVEGSSPVAVEIEAFVHQFWATAIAGEWDRLGPEYDLSPRTVGWIREVRPTEVLYAVADDAPPPWPGGFVECRVRFEHRKRPRTFHLAVRRQDDDPNGPWTLDGGL